MPELQLVGVDGEQCEERIRVVPEDVGVVGPAVLEAMFLREPHELDEARVRRVRQDGDAERQHRASW